jgi:anti-sigma28 factor (negative regulator of flagellin synthesis)
MHQHDTHPDPHERRNGPARLAKIARIRQEIADGSYDRDGVKLGAAAEILAVELARRELDPERWDGQE